MVRGHTLPSFYRETRWPITGRTNCANIAPCQVEKCIEMLLIEKYLGVSVRSPKIMKPPPYS